MAPEQITNTRISPAVDIYALGLIAFTLLVGVAYWAEDLNEAPDPISFALIAGKGPEEPASIRAARYDVTLPAGLDAWFAKVTAPEPADRFATAVAAISALAELFDMSLLISALRPESFRPRPTCQRPTSSNRSRVPNAGRKPPSCRTRAAKVTAKPRSSAAERERSLPRRRWVRSLPRRCPLQSLQGCCARNRS
jgi:serine/threonine protein kinase